MESMYYYIGLDVHKKLISYCVKDASGRIHAQGKIAATRATTLQERYVTVRNNYVGCLFTQPALPRERFAGVSVLREDPSHRGERWNCVHRRGNTG